MGRIGFGELLLILAVVLLFVGARRLPALARSLGEAIREFQRSLKGDHKDERNNHQ
jgi:sec-independent protein translocase protein TatA